MRYVLLAVMCVGTVFAQEQANPLEASGYSVGGPLTTSDKAAKKFDENEPQISIEVRFLSAPPEFFQGMNANDLIRTPPAAAKPKLPSVSDEQLRASNGIQLVSATRVVKERNPVFVRRLDDKRAFNLIKAAQADERSNILFAPKVTLFDGQDANVKDQVQRPFVVGLKRVGNAFQPQVRVIDNGTSVQIRAKTKDDLKFVRLDLGVELSEITDVKTKSAGPENAFVQIPQVTASQVSLSAMVADGDTLVISGLRRTREVRKERKMLGMFKNTSIGRETDNMLILITPRIIVPDQQAGRVKLDNRVSQADWCGTPVAHNKMIAARRQR